MEPNKAKGGGERVGGGAAAGQLYAARVKA